MAGISVRHGSQFVAQKLTQVIRPAPSARVQRRPARSSAEMDGRGLADQVPTVSRIVPAQERDGGQHAQDDDQQTDAGQRQQGAAPRDASVRELGGEGSHASRSIGASRRSTPSRVITGIRKP